MTITTDEFRIQLALRSPPAPPDTNKMVPTNGPMADGTNLALGKAGIAQPQGF
nr:hypothetical protein [Anaerolineae bacterium]